MSYKISEVLHYAADYCLNPGDVLVFTEDNYWQCTYSCDAVDLALRVLFEDLAPFVSYVHLHTMREKLYRRIMAGLREMGVDPDSSYMYMEFGSGQDVQRQGARYLWLKWAALMAEEQGE